MPKGISLHVGINHLNPDHYVSKVTGRGWKGELKACEADANDMATIAKDLGFITQTLLSANATRKSVISAIEKASKDCKEGDIFFFTYAGHGGQVPDQNFDDDDGADETLCLHDGQLIDDELLVLWSKFAKGTRIIMVADSCNSGTASRGPLGSTVTADDFEAMEIKSRYMHTDYAINTYRTNQGFYDDIARNIPSTLPEPTATVQLIGAAQDGQSAMDGLFNGLFTSHFKRVWKNGQFSGSYNEFFHALKQSMARETQVPNHFIFGGSPDSFKKEDAFSIGEGSVDDGENEPTVSNHRIAFMREAAKKASRIPRAKSRGLGEVSHLDNITLIQSVTLDEGRFVREQHTKKQIYIHHTAGFGDPAGVIADWNKREPNWRIATWAVIAGRKKRNWHRHTDGDVYRAFSSSYWANHLGVKDKTITEPGLTGRKLHHHSIGIELCNMGPVRKRGEGKYSRLKFQKIEFDDTEVIEYPNKFREHQYYERYTEAQIEALKHLLLYLCEYYDIPKDYKCGDFSYNQEAVNGAPGIWTHTNVRKDKSDCHPQPELVAMLKSLKDL